MRIHLRISPSKEIVPFNHVPVLVGAFHKWLGPNAIHDEMSLYSFSWLLGGTRKNTGLTFPKGAKWFISAFDDKVIRTILKGILDNPSLSFGMEITDVQIAENPLFTNKGNFFLASPILIKRTEGDKQKFYLYSDKNANLYMTETLKSKLKKVGLPSENITVIFDDKYSKPRTKLIDYNGIKNKASFCPVLISGSPEQIAFAWNVGIGNCTGIGFGALQ